MVSMILKTRSNMSPYTDTQLQTATSRRGFGAAELEREAFDIRSSMVKIYPYS
jgi:hypothetical protein